MYKKVSNSRFLSVSNRVQQRERGLQIVVVRRFCLRRFEKRREREQKNDDFENFDDRRPPSKPPAPKSSSSSSSSFSSTHHQHHSRGRVPIERAGGGSHRGAKAGRGARGMVRRTRVLRDRTRGETSDDVGETRKRLRSDASGGQKRARADDTFACRHSGRRV